MPRRFLALALRCAVLGAVLVMLPAPAWAHVTINPREAPQGGFTKLAFRVPNERDNASTVRLEVAFPQDRPLAFVSVKPVQGWTYLVDKQRLPAPIKVEGQDLSEAVTRITWSASGPATAIKPGEFEEFEVSAGPLPSEGDTLVFKAIQTYSSGEEVRWIEEPRPGGQEPPRPAPVLRLVAQTQSTITALGGQSAGGTTNTPRDAVSAQAVNSAMRLAILGLIVGLLGLLAGIVAYVTRPRRRSDVPLEPQSGGAYPGQ